LFWKLFWKLLLLGRAVIYSSWMGLRSDALRQRDVDSTSRRRGKTIPRRRSS
jgi:hypothetical protein